MIDPVTMQTRKRGAVAAIRTRYHGPTDHRGSRFTATSDDARDRRRLTVGYDYALDIDANHAAAADAWLDKFQPRRRRTFGALIFAGDHYHTWTDRGAA